ncbi:hypothetical protein BH23ACT7_BH23ACT7_08860 [soil metagenome]|nr:hypothetical protein [Euzebyaceae bacterium]
MLARHRSTIGLYAIVAAATGVLIEPLLAVAYFDTVGGAEQLDVPTVAAWAVPARELFGGLVTWASADVVYNTYTLIMALMFPAVIAVALATRAQRPELRKRSERVGWRIALTGYGLFGAGVLLVAVMVISAAPDALVDAGFMALMIPGMLLSMIGSTILGIVFLRTGHQPRLTGWLLACSLPLLIVGSAVVGHNGFGILPLMIAWAATGSRWRAADNAPPIEPAGRPLTQHG